MLGCVVPHYRMLDKLDQVGEPPLSLIWGLLLDRGREPPRILCSS
jgi:hypothetical protein